MQLKCRKKKDFSVCGEGAVTDWMCQKWFVKFCAGDFLLDNALLWGRPVEVESDQIETLIENNWRYTWYTQNIQVNEIIGENEKCVFYFMEKNLMDFLANPVK